MIDYEPIPYIGVTGFTEPNQVQTALEAIPTNAFRNLMVGVLANWRSLREEPSTPLTHKRFPNLDTIKDIFQPHEKALNLIHYNTSKEFANSTLSDLIQLHELAGPHMHGFQLNIAWPEIDIIKRYRRAVESSKIVLQVGGGAFREAGNTPEGLVEKLYPYIDVIDYVLLDRSGGEGRTLDAEALRPFLDAIGERRWGVGLGVAGGLEADTLNLIEPLISSYPTISIDAEGRLRDEQNEFLIEKAQNFIKKGYQLLD